MDVSPNINSISWQRWLVNFCMYKQALLSFWTTRSDTVGRWTGCTWVTCGLHLRMMMSNLASFIVLTFDTRGGLSPRVGRPCRVLEVYC